MQLSAGGMDASMALTWGALAAHWPQQTGGAPRARAAPEALKRLRVCVLLDISHRSVLQVPPHWVCRAHLPRHTPTMLGWRGTGPGRSTQ